MDVRLRAIAGRNHELGPACSKGRHVWWEAAQFLEAKRFEDAGVEGYDGGVVGLSDFDEDVGDGHFGGCEVN